MRTNAASIQGAGKRSRRGLAALAVLLLALPLAGCVSSRLETLAVNSAPSANGGRPLSIDLVFVTEKGAFETLSRLPSREYFARQEQLQRDFPRSYVFQRWEIQAGQFQQALSVKAPRGLVGALIFVNYRGDGDHRQRLGSEKAGTLMLGETEFQWIPEAR
jgi:hypothetical protein